MSVVVPTYNRAHLLERALRSVLGQTYSDLELIVVDDGSSDETKECVERLRDPRIVFIRHETNRGACAARNTGIRHARGDYIGFLDSDNEWHATKIAKQLAVFEASRFPSLAVVSCGRRLIGPDAVSAHFPTKAGFVYEELLNRRVGVWDTNTFLVRRRASGSIYSTKNCPPARIMTIWSASLRNIKSTTYMKFWWIAITTTPARGSPITNWKAGFGFSINTRPRLRPFPGHSPITTRESAFSTTTGTTCGWREGTSLKRRWRVPDDLSTGFGSPPHTWVDTFCSCC